MRKFVNIDEIADALGVHRSTVTKRAQSEGWVDTPFRQKTQGGKNGTKKLYAVDTLPYNISTALLEK